MPLITYLSRPFEYSHENHGFNFLINKLPEIIPKEEDWALVGNFSTGSDNDALLVKNDAIILIEMKDYSGALKCAKQSGDWEIETNTNNRSETVKIRGGAGNKNPFEQIKNNQQQFYKNKLESLNKKDYPEYYALIFFHGMGDFSVTKFELPKTPYMSAGLGDNIEGTFHIVGRNDLNNKVRNHFISHLSKRWTNDQIKTFVESLGVSLYQEYLFKQILDFKGYYGMNDPRIELIDGEVNGPIRRNDKIYISIYHYLEFKRESVNSYDKNKAGAYFKSISNGDYVTVTYKLRSGVVQTTHRYDYNLIERNKKELEKFRIQTPQ
jgi:hypothetical protein